MGPTPPPIGIRDDPGTCGTTTRTRPTSTTHPGPGSTAAPTTTDPPARSTANRSLPGRPTTAPAPAGRIKSGVGRFAGAQFHAGWLAGAPTAPLISSQVAPAPISIHLACDLTLSACRVG